VNPHELVFRKTKTPKPGVAEWTARADGFQFVITTCKEAAGHTSHFMFVYGDEAGLISRHGFFYSMAEMKAEAQRVHAHLTKEQSA
jgi:hypothetical protein